MRTLLRLGTLLLLASGAAAAAHADVADYKTHVLDPVSTPFPTNPVVGREFAITYTACSAGELPGGMTADGCFAGVNRSGLNWTELELLFPNTPALGSQPASCAPAPSDNIFSITSCGLDPDGGSYTLDFAGGTLADGALFFITEDGVPYDQFPTGTGVVLAGYSSATPEPSTLLLLGTGMTLLAGAAYRNRTA